MRDDFESRFYEFLQSHGYCSEAANYEYLRTYLDYFAPGERILDLGCGRGEFMELLLEHGCHPEGVDSDPHMVEICQSKGLAAHLDDVFVFLRARPEAYDSIFASNFVEHFSPAQVAELFSLVYQALKPGGKVLVAVPNPESLIVHLHEFWRDATHVRLYNRQLLEFMLTYSGFEVVAAGENEATSWQPRLEESLVSPVQVPLVSEDRLVLPRVITPAQSPHSALSPKQGNLFYHLATAVRDWFARFLADRILFRSFIPLQEETESLRQELQVTWDYLAQVAESTREATAQINQNTMALKSDLQSLRAGVLSMYPSREVYVLGRRGGL